MTPEFQTANVAKVCSGDKCQGGIEQSSAFARDIAVQLGAPQQAINAGRGR